MLVALSFVLNLQMGLRTKIGRVLERVSSILDASRTGECDGDSGDEAALNQAPSEVDVEFLDCKLLPEQPEIARSLPELDVDCFSEEVSESEANSTKKITPKKCILNSPNKSCKLFFLNFTH